MNEMQIHTDKILLTNCWIHQSVKCPPMNHTSCTCPKIFCFLKPSLHCILWISLCLWVSFLFWLSSLHLCLPLACLHPCHSETLPPPSLSSPTDHKPINDTNLHHSHWAQWAWFTPLITYNLSWGNFRHTHICTHYCNLLTHIASHHIIPDTCTTYTHLKTSPHLPPLYCLW